MAALLDAGLDLGALAGCFVAIALLAIIAYLLDGLANAIDVDVFGYHPFSGVASAIKGVVTGGIGSAIKALESAAASFEQGLLDSLELLAGIALVLADGVYVALKALWTHALTPFVNHVVADIRVNVKGLEQDVASLYTLTAADLGKAETYADKQVSDASAALYNIIRSEVHAAIGTAEGYADDAVSKLRTAESEALNKAVAGLNAGIEAAKAAAHTAETEAEAFASGKVAKAEALANTAIADVRGIAVGAEDDIETLIGKYGLAGAAGLIASIPLLATLVNTIASESGLDNSACRGKVKNICATDPRSWERLLGLAGFLAIGFDFQDFVNAAELVAKGIGSGVAELEKPFKLHLPPLELAA